MSDHAIQNAKAWMKNIEQFARLLNNWDAVEAAREAEEPGDEQKELLELAEEYEDEDALRTSIQESPLDVQVRTGWHSPGDDSPYREYLILLSTGGPALRITGDLNYGEPETAKLQWQDWFEPWTDTAGDEAAMLTFASNFWFGE